jgi:hypothetical protein
MAFVKQISAYRKITLQVDSGFIHTGSEIIVERTKDDPMSVKEAYELAWNTVTAQVMHQAGLVTTVPGTLEHEMFGDVDGK